MKKVIILWLSVMMISCHSAAKFDGEKAMAYLVEQCEIGPRHPGSTGHEKAKNYYIEFLKNYTDNILLQEFDQEIPRDSVTFHLTNIIAGFGVEKGNALLVGAHWDTRPRAEFDPDPARRHLPILGANDGASGIAVLMHLAEILAQKEPERAVYLVFFDGEDYGYHDSNEFFCMGSKYFAANLPVKDITEAIIVDMIGDQYLEIPIERGSYRSHKNLVDRLWKIAKDRGYDGFQKQMGSEIYDDHVPLIEAGIPSVDLIDFTYPHSYTNYWHTHADTPDKCSAESLEQVGQVVLDFILGK
ncbi:MAG: M28 family peptidase [Candidatus Marinimicrobia bacterium]|nr:M28 family peptidase [Candidatus Neomarinimicrobiota bacterium]